MSSKETNHLKMERGFWGRRRVEEAANLQAPEMSLESKRQAAVEVCKQCPVRTACAPKMSQAKILGIFPVNFLTVQGRHAGTDNCLLKNQGIDV